MDFKVASSEYYLNYELCQNYCFCWEFFLLLFFALIELELCALVDNYYKSCFNLKFHPLTILPYSLYLFILVYMCSFIYIGLESQAV